MTRDDLIELLRRRSGASWELYEKRALARETRSTAEGVTASERREEGWAARFWESGAGRFAAASSPERLAVALKAVAALPGAPGPSPDWPEGGGGAAPPDPPDPAEPPRELFEDLARELAAESRGEAVLTELTLRRGLVTERVANGKGGEAALASERFDGVALAVGRRGSDACEARLVFRAEGGLDVPALARRLADRATLPLSGRATPFTRGAWLLDPSVAAALLSALAPLFTADSLPPWVSRSRFASSLVTLVDDATADAAFDGEGVPTRRCVLVTDGRFRARLHDLTSAKRLGAKPTGHGARPSYRQPPAAAPRRLFLETTAGTAPLELLASVSRGLFAAAPTAPVRVDLAADRFSLEFTGVAIVAGRAQGPIAGARATGRVSELLHRIAAVATDRQFFPMPDPVGAPTLLVERCAFD
jgi:predicted Zn-dependent protease